MYAYIRNWEEVPLLALRASSLGHFHSLPAVPLSFPSLGSLACGPLVPSPCLAWTCSFSCSAPACTDCVQTFPIDPALAPHTLVITVLRGWPSVFSHHPATLTGSALRVGGLKGRECLSLMTLFLWGLKHFLELMYTSWQYIAGGRND